MNAIVETQNLPAIEPRSSPGLALLNLAANRGASVEEMREWMALHREFEANEARKAYVAAMARFKSQPIIVEKDRTVDFTSAKGRTHYKHASLAAVVDAVVSRMGQFGLAHKWNVDQAEGAVTVTCVITHEFGHSESVVLTGPRDDTGNKNPLQQISSSITYLQRYTLMSLCGLASKEMDDDGRSGGGAAGMPETLTVDQQTAINDLIKERVRNPQKFLDWIGAASVAEIPAKDFARAKAELMLQAKKS